MLRTGRWLGAFSEELGLAQGSTVQAKDFESLYYGLHPRTGQALRSDGKSKRTQMQDAKRRETCVQARQFALTALNQARQAVQASPNNPEAQSNLVQCQQAFAVADAALRSAQQKSLRPGSDLVFSAPKSVSMQWAALLAKGDTAGATGIEHAHDQAVRKTFEQIQGQFVMTRKRGENSERILEAVQGVIACQWRHFDARPTERRSASEGATDGASNNPAQNTPPVGLPDPQLHDHINLFAPVKGSDGAIYAAYTDYIRHNIKALGAMYRAHLSQNLVACGYRVERDAQAQGLFFGLSGIGREQVKVMSARTADIAALQGRGLAANEAKLYSRKAKNQLSGWEVLQGWQAVFAHMGLDPQQVKTATLGDSIALDAWHKGVDTQDWESFARAAARERMPGERTNAAILDALLEREAYFSLSDIRQLLWEDAQFVGGKEADLDRYVERRLRGILQSPGLLQIMDPAHAPPIGISPPAQPASKLPPAPARSYAASHLTGLNRYAEPVFTTHALRKREEALFNGTVPSLLHSSGYGVDTAGATTVIAQVEERISKKQVEADGKAFVLRDFQLAAVMQAACGDSQLCIQIAGAGMGKTTSAQFVKEILTSQGRSLIGVAPSNKAASGLSRELGIPTSSIDRLLLDLDAGRATLDRQSVVLVDEAGMAGFDVIERLMAWGVKTGAKLILMGDPEQLPAVSRGNVLRKLTQMEVVAQTPNALLYLGKNLSDWNRISRQKDDWAKQASMFFSQGLVAEGLREYNQRGCVHRAWTQEHLREDLIRAYLGDPAAAKNKLILATTNAQVNAMNQAVRADLKSHGKLTGSWRLPDSTFELSLGDRIVFKQGVQGKQKRAAPNVKGSPSPAIAKNEFATVRSIARQPDGSLDVQCELDTQGAHGKPTFVKLNTKDMGDLDHAFASTVHRSQGMTVDAVYAVASTFLSKELFYVMATRHRERFHVHMLEQDRSIIMQRAASALPKWHALDLHSILGNELAISEVGQLVWERLRGGLEKVAVWMRTECTRYAHAMQMHGAAHTSAGASMTIGQRDATRARVRALLYSLRSWQLKARTSDQHQRPNLPASNNLPQGREPAKPAQDLCR